MSAPLFLVDSLPPIGAFRLTGPEGHHASDVQRLRPGEPVTLADGRGGTASTVVTAAGRGTLELDVAGYGTVPAPDPRLIVVQGIAKGERDVAAVQMMTEAGVDEIVPWAAERCVVRWHGDRGERSLQRWRVTAREAAKQSRRAWLPTVGAAAATDGLARRWRPGCGAAPGPGTSAVLVLHEEATVRLTEVALPGSGDIYLVVGPEGGIAPAEIDRFTRCGGSPVRLGDTVLRTSTAGVAALAVLSARLGRW